MKQVVKQIVFAIGASAPLMMRRLDAIRRAGVITVLNMHRVAPSDGSDYRPVDPKIFKSTLEYLRQYFEITTFARANEQASHKPKAIISFDDGYKDFIEHAAPILDDLGLVCNQNVIPHCIETGLPPLNVMVQDFVGKAPRELVQRLEVPGFGRKVTKHDGFQLSRFLKNRNYASQQALSAEVIPQLFKWQEFKPTPMMTREEVLGAAHQHEIGAHSYGHASMEYETLEFLLDDVRRCRAYFEEALSLSMDIYAFPNGSCADGQAEVVLNQGVRDVLLVGESFDRGGRVRKRFTFDGMTKEEARFRALGGFARVES